MGVWALDLFGNDAAADLGFELEDAESNEAVLAILRERFATVVNGEYDDVYASDYDEALAAAALLIAVDDTSVLPPTAEHYGPTPWPPAGLVISSELRSWARRAVDRSLDPRENQWFDVSDEVDLWPEQVAKATDLQSRLSDA